MGDDSIATNSVVVMGLGLLAVLGLARGTARANAQREAARREPRPAIYYLVIVATAVVCIIAGNLLLRG